MPGPARTAAVLAALAASGPVKVPTPPGSPWSRARFRSRDAGPETGPPEDWGGTPAVAATFAPPPRHSSSRDAARARYIGAPP